MTTFENGQFAVWSESVTERLSSRPIG